MNISCNNSNVKVVEVLVVVDVVVILVVKLIVEVIQKWK